MVNTHQILEYIILYHTHGFKCIDIFKYYHLFCVIMVLSQFHSQSEKEIYIRVVMFVFRQLKIISLALRTERKNQFLFTQ